jgi:hypothetical protein
MVVRSLLFILIEHKYLAIGQMKKAQKNQVVWTLNLDVSAL